MRVILYLTILCALSAVNTADSGTDLAARTRSLAAPIVGLAENLVDKLASTIGSGKRLLNSRDLEDLVAWRGRLDPTNGRSYFAASIAVNKCSARQDCVSNLGSYPYESYMVDPTGESNQPVLKIQYPKGSWSPGSVKPGGTLFFAYPYKAIPTSGDNPLSKQSATFEYEVYFPNDFDFVKGGKLPGMAGGAKNGRGCGGGVDPDSCFSYRIMWRADGHGEAYVYAKEGEQGPDFCTKFPSCRLKKFPCTLCDYAHGVSFGRGSFKFQRGVWQQIRMTITLNDPDNNNGYLGLEYNGNLVASYDQMKWRTSEAMNIEGVEVSSWFGGSDATWSPPKDTHILLRNLKVYRTGPATAASLADGGRSAIGTPGPNKQTVVEEVMDIAPW
ncbi:hypothetical protein Ndes2526B_g00860 [Nannochloris sp. 'desiccata']